LSESEVVHGPRELPIAYAERAVAGHPCEIGRGTIEDVDVVEAGDEEPIGYLRDQILERAVPRFEDEVEAIRTELVRT
jgi:hypothetical protein